ncbi:patatin-like phospholipase family protein [Pseudomonas edaphica]|uniref:Patatin-like phospholipase family protein n=1 Tax=Pseudomonas edaphica TaxID=2006980 RepID=A0A7Y8KCX8_9PSED|nr:MULTISPECIES: patatin-like phospholipase family protein [Pseudomonas]NWC48927.1 patatin-like phospholipase family protein [Pseudomonas sp. IPO3747]NWE06423.1 patatin-like phospholipase family protein [Pseudomonas edaphica]NWE83260.1 patatin-like phospholipase family protein [Pseudomonas edaphica]
MESRHPVFLAFQGGGAKGVVHAGALLAINDLDLEIKGVAGTSAGSMIAALIASGYTGKELVDPDEEKHLFQTITPELGIHRATDIFSKKAWRILTIGRSLPAHIRSFKTFYLKMIAPYLGGKPNIYWFYGALALFFILLATCPTIAQFVAGLSTLGVIALGVALRWVSGGISTVGEVRRLIDGAIRKKLGVEKHNITFRDLKDNGGLPLKIISTNILGECLELFCFERTPDTPVADAVAASICLPVIFSPWPLKFRRGTENLDRNVSGSFFDGGLMSNLPAWPFDEERLIYPGTTTIALGISPNVPTAAASKAKHWLGSVINAIVSGTGEIHTRAVGRIIKIPLRCRLGLLDFDAPIDEIYEEVRRSRNQVHHQLRRELTTYPDVISDATNVLQAGIIAQLANYRGRWFSEAIEGHTIRVAIGAQRAGAMNSLSLVSQAGFMDHHPDSKITLPLIGSAAGIAWSEGAVVAALPWDEDMELHALDKMWDQVKWFMCFRVTPRPWLPIAKVLTPPPKAPFLGKMHGEMAKIRPIVIIIDGTMPFDDSLEQAYDDILECIERIQESAVEYLRRRDLDFILQGSNSWL